MRFVTVKTAAQHTLLALHRVRVALVAERTSTVNQIHAFLREFGIGLPAGAQAIARLRLLFDDPAKVLPPRLVAVLMRLHRSHAQLNRDTIEVEGDLKHQL